MEGRRGKKAIALMLIVVSTVLNFAHPSTASTDDDAIYNPAVPNDDRKIMLPSEADSISLGRSRTPPSPPAPTDDCRTNADCPRGFRCIDERCIDGRLEEGSTDDATYNLVADNNRKIMHPFSHEADSVMRNGCRTNADCPRGFRCIDGRCIDGRLEEGSTDDATYNLVADNNRKIMHPFSHEADSVMRNGCRTNADCPRGFRCIDGRCIDGRLEEGSADDATYNLVAVNNRKIMHPFSHEADSVMRNGCRTNADCPMGFRCIDGRCIDGRLEEGSTDDATYNLVVINNMNITPSSSHETDSVMRTRCRTNAECPKHYKCIDGKCINGGLEEGSTSVPS